MGYPQKEERSEPRGSHLQAAEDLLREFSAGAEPRFLRDPLRFSRGSVRGKSASFQEMRGRIWKSRLDEGLCPGCLAPAGESAQEVRLRWRVFTCKECGWVEEEGVVRRARRSFLQGGEWLIHRSYVSRPLAPEVERWAPDLVRYVNACAKAKKVFVGAWIMCWVILVLLLFIMF